MKFFYFSNLGIIFLLIESSALFCARFGSDESTNIQSDRIYSFTSIERTNDSLALTALFDATNGASWINKSGWKSTSTLENWSGVTIFNDRVAKLNLINNNLSGVLPFQMQNLTELKELDLSNNNLTGGLNNLVSLQKLYETDGILDLRNNKLDFLDLFPLQGKSFGYNPQDSIGISGQITLQSGSNFDLSAGDDSTFFCEYTWKKDGNILPAQTAQKLFLNFVNSQDAGLYTCDVTNVQFPLCTLYRRKYLIKVEGSSSLTLKSPINNSKINTLKPTFKWNKLSGADNYKVFIRKDTDFGSMSDNIRIDVLNDVDTALHFSTLQNNTQYFWRVGAYNGSNLLLWSEIWSFTTEFIDKVRITARTDKTIVCPGEEFRLSVEVTNGSGNYQYRWFNVEDGDLSNQNPISITDKNYYVSDHTNKIYIEVTDLTKGDVILDSVSVIVKAHKIPLLKNPGTFPNVAVNKFSDEDIILESEGLSGYSYIWLNSSKSQINTGINLNIGKLSKGNYIFYLKNKNNTSGCESYNELQINLNVSDRNLEITGTRDYKVCEGNSVEIGRDVVIKSNGIEQDLNNYNYLWSAVSGSDITLIDNINNRITNFKGKVLSAKVDEFYNYKLTITNKSNSNIKGEFTVNISNFYLPVPSVKPVADVDYNSNATIELNNYNSAWTYSLYDSNNNFLANFTSNKFTTSPLTQDIEYYIGARRSSGENGCATLSGERTNVKIKLKNIENFGITINGASKLSETIIMCEGDPEKNIDINISGGSNDFTINTPENDNNVKFTKNTKSVNIKVSSTEIVTNKNYEISITDNISKIEKKASIILTVNPKPKIFQIDLINEKIYESVPVLFKIINAEAGVIYNFESQGAVVEMLSETSANLSWSTTGSKTVNITAQKGECKRDTIISVEVQSFQSNIEISLDKAEAEPGENITITIKPILPEGFRDTITVSYSKYELFNRSQKILNDDALISVPVEGSNSKIHELIVLVGKQDEVILSASSKLITPIISKTLKIKPVTIAGKEFRLRQSNNKIDISPNPAANNVKVNLKGFCIGIATLKIVNPLGILIESRQIDFSQNLEIEEQLDLSYYKSGIYSLILISAEGLEIKNFVIIK